MNQALIPNTQDQMRRGWHNYRKKPYNNYPVYLTHVSPHQNIYKSSFCPSLCQPCKRPQSKGQKMQLNSLAIIYWRREINDGLKHSMIY